MPVLRDISSFGDGIPAVTGDVGVVRYVVAACLPRRAFLLVAMIKSSAERSHPLVDTLSPSADFQRETLSVTYS